MVRIVYYATVFIRGRVEVATETLLVSKDKFCLHLHIRNSDKVIELQIINTQI